MKIAPIDIAHKSFARKFMGLDTDEVTDFLKNVADEMEALVRERNSLRESLRDKELSIAEFRERDGMLKTTLTTATQMSEKIRQDAEREARLITDDARQKADLIVRDARDSLRKIYNEISDLKNIRVQFETNLRALAQAHLAMIEQGEKIMPDPRIEKPHDLGHAASPPPFPASN
jgi:cell division initiation protein